MCGLLEDVLKEVAEQSDLYVVQDGKENSRLTHSFWVEWAPEYSNTCYDMYQIF